MAKLPFAVVPLALGTIATGNERTTNPAAYLDNPYIGMTWKTNGTASAFIRGQLGSMAEIDFVSLLCANAVAGTTIRVRLGMSQAEVDGTATYDSGTLPIIPFLEASEGSMTLSLDFLTPRYQLRSYPAKSHSHLEIPAPVLATWWRIDIGGHTGDFEASRLIIGKRITPSRFYDRDFERGVEDLGGLNISRNGVIHVTPGQKLRTLKFTLSWMTEVEFEEMFRPMIEQIGNTGLVYWCFDPEPTSYRQGRTYYGWFRQQPYATGGAKPKTYQKDFQISSLI